MDKEFYVPDVDYLETRRIERKIEQNSAQGQPDLFPEATESQPRYLAAQSKTNRQGREEVLPPEEARQVLEWIRNDSARNYSTYVKLLNEDAHGIILNENRHGLARELARMVLPTNIYTQWYWKTDLHNLLHFLSLRADPHAQYEIRVYADAMLEILKRWLPLVHEAFVEYRMNAATISAKGLEVIRRKIAGEHIEQKDSGLSPREWRELMAVLDREA